MPDGKPAGVRCVQLSPDNQCEIYGRPDRPAVCLSYQASESCGTDRVVVTPGEVQLMAGPSSANLPLRASFSIVGAAATLAARTVHLTTSKVAYR